MNNVSRRTAFRPDRARVFKEDRFGRSLEDLTSDKLNSSLRWLRARMRTLAYEVTTSSSAVCTYFEWFQFMWAAVDRRSMTPARYPATAVATWNPIVSMDFAKSVATSEHVRYLLPSSTVNKHRYPSELFNICVDELVSNYLSSASELRGRE